MQKRANFCCKMNRDDRVMENEYETMDGFRCLIIVARDSGFDRY